LRPGAAVALFALTLGTVPAAPARDGDYDAVFLDARLFTGLPHELVYQDPYVYAAVDTGIEIFDVTDLANPRSIGSLYLPGVAYDLALAGQVAFVANGEMGLAVIDLADPTTPTLVAQLPPPMASQIVARGIDVAAGIAYLAETAAISAGYGLRTIDIADPTTPVELGRVALDNGALSVAVVGTAAVVGLGSAVGGRHGLVAIDVSDPTSPAEIATGFVATGGAVNDIARDGTTLYAASGYRSTGALTVADFADPSSPMVLDALSMSDGASGVDLAPGRVHVAARERGLRVIDRTDPFALAEVGAVVLGEAAVAVAVRGDAAFVGSRSSNGVGGLIALDTIASNPLVRGAYAHAEATGVATTAAIAYLLRRDALHVFDTSTPAAPVWLSAWRPPDGDFSAIDADGTLVALSEGTGVHLIDVGDPSSPMALGSVQVSEGIAGRVRLDGATLHVVTGRGLETFDVTDPSAPAATSLLSTAGLAAAVAVDGAVGYLVAGEELLVLDRSSPSTPVIQGSLVLPGEQLLGVDADGDLAVVSGRHERMYTIDVSMPSSPSLVASLAGGDGHDILLHGEQALIAAGGAGLRVVNVSDPAALSEDGFFDTSGSAQALAVDGIHVFVATMAAQHWTVECTACTVVCSETWPTIEPNTLLVVKVPTRDTFHWTVASGAGSFNLHRTDRKEALPDLWMDMATVAASSPIDSVVEPFLPPTPTGLAHYRVFGSGSCTGSSYP